MNEELELLVDKNGLSKVLFALSEICHRKAEHIATHWQDASLAKEWNKDGSAIERLAVKIRTI